MFIHSVLYICTGPTTNCFVCDAWDRSKRNVKGSRKLTTIPQSFIQYCFAKRRCILQPSAKVCLPCLGIIKSNKKHVHIKHWEKYKSHKHNLSAAWIINLKGNINRLYDYKHGPNTRQRRKLNKLNNQIAKLEQQNIDNMYGFTYKKYTRNVFNTSKQKEQEQKRMEEMYEKHCFEFKQDDEKQNEMTKTRKKTNRDINSISVELCTNYDCYQLTRLTREQLKEQSDLLGIEQIRLFHFWFRLYRYEPYRVQELMFGPSKAILQKWFYRTTKELYQHWAKTKLTSNLPKHRQYWTRETINENTTKYSKLLWNLNENRIAVIMDGTYVYHQVCHTNHDIFQHSFSIHKKRNLLKPHMQCTTNGKIITPGRVHYSDGRHNDKSIFDITFCKEYIQHCTDNPQDDDVVFRDDYLEELQYMNFYLYDEDDVFICDNGYEHCRDKRVHTPNKISRKRTQLSTKHIADRRKITYCRDVIERINNSFKQFRMLGDKISTNEIALLNDLICIASAYHNEYNEVFYHDHSKNEELTARYLNVKEVEINPCQKYYIKRPPNKKKKTKQKKKTKRKKNQKQQLDDDDDEQLSEEQYLDDDDEQYVDNHNKKKKFDDGFNLIAKGKEKIIEYIQSDNILNEIWLQIMPSYKDVEQIIGRTFQIRLAKGYLQNADETLKLHQHKKNKYVWKFSNVKSRYSSSKRRIVILNFEEIIKHLNKNGNLEETSKPEEIMMLSEQKHEKNDDDSSQTSEHESDDNIMRLMDWPHSQQQKKRLKKKRLQKKRNANLTDEVFDATTYKNDDLDTTPKVRRSPRLAKKRLKKQQKDGKSIGSDNASSFDNVDLDLCSSSSDNLCTSSSEHEQVDDNEQHLVDDNVHLDLCSSSSDEDVQQQQHEPNIDDIMKFIGSEKIRQLLIDADEILKWREDYLKLKHTINLRTCVDDILKWREDYLKKKKIDDVENDDITPPTISPELEIGEEQQHDDDVENDDITPPTISPEMEIGDEQQQQEDEVENDELKELELTDITPIGTTTTISNENDVDNQQQQDDESEFESSDQSEEWMCSDCEHSPSRREYFCERCHHIKTCFQYNEDSQKHGKRFRQDKKELLGQKQLHLNIYDYKQWKKFTISRPHFVQFFFIFFVLFFCCCCCISLTLNIAHVLKNNLKHYGQHH